MKIVINSCYGGFGLSQKAYEKLIEYGIPVKKYIKERRDYKTGKYIPNPENDGEVIFQADEEDILIQSKYWDTWTRDSRTHPLLVKAVEELGEEAGYKYSKLKVIEIPDGIEYTIEEYDGAEWVAEKHRVWE